MQVPLSFLFPSPEFFSKKPQNVFTFSALHGKIKRMKFLLEGEMEK